MRAPARVEIDVHLERDGLTESLARDVRHGLAAVPKRLPSKYFYDDHGSRLFERITEQPEYYLTRAEQALLDERGPEIARLTRPAELVELGSGSAKKTRSLIDAAMAEGTLRRYLPVDVAAEMAERSARQLARSYPWLRIHAVVGDFENVLDKVPQGEDRLVALLGSTIGNFPGARAVEFLRKASTLLDRGDWFLLGTDLVKDKARLEAAYNDGAGITAEFNLNLLNVINRHLDADFDTAQFEHRSFYNEKAARIESYLRSRRRQTVHIAALDMQVEFGEGELLWTEVSCKYTRESCERLFAEAGLTLRHWITDDDATFALSLAQR